MGGTFQSTVCPMDELDTTLANVVGAKIKVKTLIDTELEGKLFTACSRLNLIVIDSADDVSGTNRKSNHIRNPQAGVSADTVNKISDYHIIPVSSIKQFHVISLAPEGSRGFHSMDQPLRSLDVNKIRQREEVLVRKMKLHLSTRGKGVTPEAQEIFDALHRTLPVRWHDKELIVNDAVVIKPPYRIEDCSVDKDKQSSLNQVFKVMEAFYARKRRDNPLLRGDSGNESVGLSAQGNASSHSQKGSPNALNVAVPSITSYNSKNASSPQSAHKFRVAVPLIRKGG